MEEERAMEMENVKSAEAVIEKQPKKKHACNAKHYSLHHNSQHGQYRRARRKGFQEPTDLYVLWIHSAPPPTPTPHKRHRRAMLLLMKPLRRHRIAQQIAQLLIKAFLRRNHRFPPLLLLRS